MRHRWSSGYESGMDSNEVNKDVDEAEFSVDELRALVREQQPVIDELRWELKVAKGKINQLQERADRHPREHVAEEYSVNAEDQRRRGEAEAAEVRPSWPTNDCGEDQAG